MKKITMLVATVLGLGILAPATAQAGGCRTRCYVDRCGYTIYSEYRCVGYDCHHCPVFDWVVVRRVAPCPPPSCGPTFSFSFGGGRGCYSGHSHGGYSGGGHYHGRR